MEQDTGEHNTTTSGSEADEEEKEKWKRPPSSYGSMKSDIESTDEEEEGERPVTVLPEHPAPPEMRYTVMPSESAVSRFTETTQQTKPPGAMVIDTGSADPDELTEEELEDGDEPLYTCSPEPPEPLEMEGFMQTEEDGQPGRLDPEQDLPHIFKSIQSTLSDLSNEELFKFKTWYYTWQPGSVRTQVLQGDLLDFVDKSIELLGADKALMNTIKTLESMDKKEEAEKLKNQCKKALFRFYLKNILFRKHQIIHEGVVQAGKQSFLNNVYVEPQLSTHGCGGVDPSHEFLPQPPTPLQVPAEDTFVGVNNLFRLQKDDGSPVRTVVTTGIAGVGMSVSVAKFSLDWAEERANRDLQYVIKLSFKSLWFLRNRSNAVNMSVSEAINYYYSGVKDFKLLDEENTKVLVIMDSFDRYQATLDWQNAPVINDNYTRAPVDVLVVNIIRGNLFRGARLWILGRRAAVSQIPPEFVDVVTELQGFSDEMKDEYLTKRFSNKQLAENIVQHYKRTPTLQILARHPFFCWILATVFDRCFQYQGYGTNPPRLTPFLIHIMIIQTNRRLRFYYGKAENELKWTDTEKKLLTKMAKLAFKMLERNTSVFYEEEVKELGLSLTEVVVFSGLCTEICPPVPGRRTFCFIHYTFQEFMASLYVFLMFYLESKNVLDSGSLLKHSTLGKSAAGLVKCAVEKTLCFPLGRYEMFLRYLCGLLSSTCYFTLLRGFLYPHNSPKVTGLDVAQQQLEQAIHTATADRVDNLKECLREMIQDDD
uniref:Pyrin domain-containing protein n=1 Tax=Nothobranchius rachovii TaxID=451742 RepID=A0A1A8QSB7_9TELE